jgi:ribosomal subunit interface protein
MGIQGLSSEPGSPDMQVQISGKQIDIGDALHRHVEERLQAMVAKYFDRAIDASVVFAREAHLFDVDCSVHVGSGISVQGHGEATEIYASFDVALTHIEKQLRRSKRRRRNHHGAKPPAESIDASPARGNKPAG